MFKQFTENINGNQGYLLFSLFVFLVFFIIATILLLRMKKQHVAYMSDMPLAGGEAEPFNHLKP